MRRNVSYALLERQTERLVKQTATFRTETRHLIEVLGFQGQFPSRIALVQPGAFKHFRRSEAASAYLTLAMIPQTSAQIDAALERGKVKSEAEDHLRATYATLSYGKTTGRFRRFGLKHWQRG